MTEDPKVGEPLHEEGGSSTRRSYEEKHRLLLDLAMLLFGGLLRLLRKRSS